MIAKAVVMIPIRELAFIATLAGVLTLLAGCSRTASPTVAPAGSPYDAASTSLPQFGAPATAGNAIRSTPGIVGACSFPRSFLIPGTDTSIRIGG